MKAKKRILNNPRSQPFEQQRLETFWDHEADDLNRELAKNRTDGRTQYVKTHFRRGKKIDGYFRKPS